MAKIAVMPYAGARKWLYKQVSGIDEFVDELKLDKVLPGDKIYGVLPVNLAAAICEKGAEYFHLSVDKPELLSAEYDVFRQANPKLEAFFINGAGEAVLSRLLKNAFTLSSNKVRRIARERPPLRLADIKLAFYALMTASAIGMFANALGGALLFESHLINWFGKDSSWLEQHFSLYWVIELILCFTLFLWASWSLRLQARQWVPLRDVKRRDADQAYAGLVLTVSSGYRFEFKDERWFFIKQKHGPEIEIELTGNLNQDIENLMPLKIQWELILRIIRAQACRPNAKLKRVMFLGSQDCSIKNFDGVVERVAPGTYPHIKNALKVLAMYAEFKQIEFEPYPVPIPPNDIEAYYNAYLKIAKNWQQFYSLSEEDILIDITGGKTLNSVAAALATLHNKMQFHYIDTNNLNDVLVYAMEYRQQNI
ncbi:CRISPR-associated protein Csx16 [Catenovulum sp. 2E275]|uniref:CRISPR-associated protein Csx16 n=1 Tax=Catenovulum sp. 2E275 TaxID=2980497 RepID=UPI0021CE2292|nr:CRISPR-associated protein Csx16 [Catenovulum sp. 2E275]MCU4677172.1 CRISPR-associated protein Csx16 [Catenovulum sp. 2E275]